jgi:hypothetical protein
MFSGLSVSNTLIPGPRRRLAPLALPQDLERSLEKSIAAN